MICNSISYKYFYGFGDMLIGSKNHSRVPKFHFNQHKKAAKANPLCRPVCDTQSICMRDYQP